MEPEGIVTALRVFPGPGSCMAMNCERWVPVPVEEYRDYYEISDRGRIRRTAPHPHYVAGKVRVPNIDPHGSPIVRLSARCVQRTFAVAPLVAAVFLPPQPTPKAVLRYRDGDRTNCAAENLYWGAKAKRAPGGGRPPKLSPPQIA